MQHNIIYIDNQVAFEEAVKYLSTKNRIYIDLEFDKNHFNYGFNLCLMQIFDGDTNCYLIDPLTDLDISTIFSVLEDNSIQLVCFAFSEDMRLLHHIGAKPNNILDLAVLLRLLDHDSLSINNALALILEDDSYIKEKKSQQKSNWMLRPLVPEQLVYAAEDVIYLPELRAKSEELLEKLNREDWLAQEMESFEEHDWDGDEISNFLVAKDQKQLTLREWTRFQSIMEEREELAASINKPSFKAIDKDVMHDLAKHPEKVQNWIGTRGIHPKLKTKKVQSIMKKALEKAEKTIVDTKIKKDESSIPYLSKEEKERINSKKKQLKYYKNEFFTPIKEEVKAAYGENIANYILSNRKTTEYINQHIKPLPYQKQIILEMSKKLGLELPNFL